MLNVPSIKNTETITLKTQTNWLVGLDDRLYWWNSEKDQNHFGHSLEIKAHFNQHTETLLLPVNTVDHLLMVDERSQLYTGASITIGERIRVFTNQGKLLWDWQPHDVIHAFAYTVSDGAFWFVPTKLGNKYVYEYHPKRGCKTHALPIYDTVYSMVVTLEKRLFTTQLPLGHFVIHSDQYGNILHQLGNPQNLGKGDNENIWPIFYPEDIRMDKLGRLWVAELGRNRLVVLDQTLKVIRYLTLSDLGLNIHRKELFKPLKIALGKNFFWIHEPDPYSEEIRLHCFQIVT